MGKAIDTRDEINKITAKLIELGLSDDQNYAFLKEVADNIVEISFRQSANFSVVLRNIGYSEIYEVIKRERDFNISLADGAILQLQYLFHGEE